jgi:hypothetical protein
MCSKLQNKKKQFRSEEIGGFFADFMRIETGSEKLGNR